MRRIITERNWKPAYTKILIAVQEGCDNKSVAERVQLAESTVRWVKSSEEFKKRMTRFTGTREEVVAKTMALDDSSSAARKTLLNKAKWAADKMVELAEKGSTKDRLQLDACKEILHIAGIKGIDVVEHRERNYTDAELASMLETARQIELVTKRLVGEPSRFLLSAPRKPEEETVTDENSDEPGEDGQDIITEESLLPGT